ncbi:glycosyltransferase [Paenibacillus sp. N1-5-1-14]|uniref:glycosyltransferase n=1 Tax=Paenibacillus radicibacter TaxID=2972488 RepID=UPI0021598810|nr:glycosyltransferase [Paenibacillus radicibacter]MCR8644955.1 glycosyltransferase [Paenibacillus radicibacter]
MINLVSTHSRTTTINWDLPRSMINCIEMHYQTSLDSICPTIRLYDVTDCIDSPPRSFLMKEYRSIAATGHLQVEQLYNGRCYVADLGVFPRESVFVSLLRSAIVRVGSDEFILPVEGYPNDPFEAMVQSCKGAALFSGYTVYGDVKVGQITQEGPIGENDRDGCDEQVYSVKRGRFIEKAERGEQNVQDDLREQFPPSLWNEQEVQSLCEVSAHSSPPAALPQRQPRQNPLRIAMLAWEYPPHIVGGLGRAVEGLARHLAGLGHTVHVFTCTGSDSPAEELLDGVHVHRVQALAAPDPIHFWDRVLQVNFAIAERIAKLGMDEGAFDLIHAHDWLVLHAASQSAGALQLPLIATVHATEHGRRFGRLEPGLPAFIHELECQLMRRAAHVIVCSKSMWTEVTTVHGVPPQKVTVIPCGIDVPSVAAHAAAPKAKLGANIPASYPSNKALAPPHPNLLFIGRLVYEKGVHILIDAISQLIPSIPDLHLRIAGVGPMEAELRELARPFSKHITFVGWANEHTKHHLFQTSSLCIVPSLYEPLGIVALEAMSYGVPLVASHVGGLSEMITHSVDGWLVPAGNSTMLAAAIQHLLTHPVTFLELHQVALHTIQYRYVWSHFARQTANLYEDHLPITY